MLDRVHPWGRPLPPPRSPCVRVGVAAEPWLLAAYHRLRVEVFVAEQGLFAGDDLDAQDACATPLVAVSEIAGMADEVVGVVRIWPGEGGTWFGGRLAVSRPYRRAGQVGRLLVAAAVSTARARGCRRFLATVQLPNVAYFARHGFAGRGPAEVCGRPHLLMEAALERFPAVDAAGPRREVLACG